MSINPIGIKNNLFQEQKYQELIQYYKGTSPKQQLNIYNSIQLDTDGIDYSRFFKLYYNLSTLIQNVDASGVHLLFSLICHPHTQQSTYVSVTLKSLLSRQNYNDMRTLKKYIQLLIKHNYIYIEDYNDKKTNDDLDILILYNNHSTLGYKPIPIDYFNRCLLHLTPIQSVIVLYLIERFKLYDCYNYIDETTKKTVYSHIKCEYAFPTLDRIAKDFGADRHTIKLHIDILAKKKIISYTISNKTPFWTMTKEGYRMKNPNYRYRVRLLQRVEYNYYLIKMFNKYDTRTYEEIEDIQANMVNILNSEEYYRVKPIDWITYNYNETRFKYLERALKIQDIDFYKKNIRGDLYLFENFNNKSFI